MRRFGENWQPILYAILIVLGLSFAYVIAFVIKNSEPTEVDFVFVATSASLVWVILISLAIGLLAGVLLSQLYRRGKRDHRRETRDALPDSTGSDVAVREANRAPASAAGDEEIAPRDVGHS
jgi:uncharacterized integral membrane protein